MMRIGITGGIGSGKSTVCRLFSALGIAVYYSDEEAKRLLNGELREAITARFGAHIYATGELDRAALAATVFTDPVALADLNSIVHPAVLRDFDAWSQCQSGAYVLFESAILWEAGLMDRFDATIAVLAPVELRVARAARRDGCSEEDVRRRVAAQTDDETLRRVVDYTIWNIDEQELPAAVAVLDQTLRNGTVR